MLLDQPNAVATRGAKQRLVDAVHALSADPGPANIARYLAASQALEVAYAAEAAAVGDRTPP